MTGHDWAGDTRTVGHGHNGHSDTALHNEPGSGNIRNTGETQEEKPIVISGSHELNVNISQSEDTGTFNQSEDSFLHKICTTIKVKDHLE